MAEKSEKATPKKLRDARKKGQVAKSKDFPAAFTFVVALFGTLFFGSFYFTKLATYMLSIFRSISPNIDMEHKAGGYILGAIEVIFSTSLPLMVIVTLIGLLVNFLIIGPLFSFESMKPDIKKLNPITNLKNMFKFKTFFELLKSIFKITGALLLIFTVVYDSLPEIIATAGMPILGATMIFAKFLVQVAIRVGIFFLVIAVFDLVFQKRTFAKEMMMEKFEVKQEIKDTEGNPEIKGQRRQTAREIAYQEGPPSVKRAKAVITNPVHIAVAIEYEAEQDPAPKIVTMGKGIIADQIIQFAMQYDVPIMRNVELAQELYEIGQIGGFVPEETYEAIAEVLKWIASLEEKEEIPEIFRE